MAFPFGVAGMSLNAVLGCPACRHSGTGAAFEDGDVLKQGVNLGHCFSSCGQSEVNAPVVSERLHALLPTVLASLLEGAAHAI